MAAGAAAAATSGSVAQPAGLLPAVAAGLRQGLAAQGVAAALCNVFARYEAASAQTAAACARRWEELILGGDGDCDGGDGGDNGGEGRCDVERVVAVECARYGLLLGATAARRLSAPLGELDDARLAVLGHPSFRRRRLARRRGAVAVAEHRGEIGAYSQAQCGRSLLLRLDPYRRELSTLLEDTRQSLHQKCSSPCSIPIF